MLTVQLATPDESRHSWSGHDSILANQYLTSKAYCLEIMYKFQPLPHDLLPLLETRYDANGHLFHSIGSCHLDDDLSSLFVIVTTVSAKTNRFALHLIAQRVEQGLDPVPRHTLHEKGDLCF